MAELDLFFPTLKYWYAKTCADMKTAEGKYKLLWVGLWKLLADFNLVSIQDEKLFLPKKSYPFLKASRQGGRPSSTHGGPLQDIINSIHFSQLHTYQWD